MRRISLYLLAYILVFGAYVIYTLYSSSFFQAPILDNNSNTSYFNGIESNDQLDYRWLIQPLELSIPPVSSSHRIVRMVGVAVNNSNKVTLQISDATPVVISVQGQRFRAYHVLLRDDTMNSPLRPQVNLHITPEHFQQIGNRSISIAVHSLNVTAIQTSTIPPLWVIYIMCVMLGIALLFSTVFPHDIEYSFWFIIHIGICSLTAMEIISITSAIAASVSMMTLYGIYRYVSPIYPQFIHGSPQLSATTYRSDIDGLRALAVMAVVIYHAFPQLLPGGFIGVDIFFVISGYLITRIIIEEVYTQRFSIQHFYVRRIRRIFPALFTVLFVVALLGMVLQYRSEYIELGTQILAGTGFVSNIVLYQQVDYFGDLAINQPLLHLWSLGVEEQFYIIWPVMLLLMAKHSRLLIPSIIVLFVSSFLININTISMDLPAAFYLLPSRFWQLNAGGIVAIYTLFNPSTKSSRFNNYAIIMPLIGILLYSYGIYALDESMAFPGWYAVIPTLSGILLVLPHASNWMSDRFLSNPIFVWIGKISFPLYLWHWPLLVFGFMTLDISFTAWLKISVIGVSILLAYLTYLYIERPVRFTHTTSIKTWMLIVMIAGVSGVGWMIQKQTIPSFMPNYTVIGTGSFVKAQNCSTLFLLQSRFDINSCTIRSGPTNQSEYVIIGDSHANIFAGGLIASSKNQVMLYSYIGCLPLINIERTSLHCQKINQLPQVFQYLRDHPTVHKHRYIVLTGRYSYIEPYSLNPNIKANEQLSMEGLSIAEAKDHPEKIIEIGLRNNLLVLSDLPNTTLVILHQPPELQFSPKNCSRLSLLGIFDSAQVLGNICQTPYSLVQRHFSRYRQAVHKVLADYPAVKEFNPDSIFCNQDICIPTIDGELAYIDNHHLNYQGATRVAQLFLSEFP